MRVVEVRVNGLILEHKTQQNIVILREAEGQRILPIWIGPGEAQAIRRILSEEVFPRPLTHDLIYLMLEGLKAKITRVVIADLRENTFFASVIVERPVRNSLILSCTSLSTVELSRCRHGARNTAHLTPTCIAMVRNINWR